MNADAERLVTCPCHCSIVASPERLLLGARSPKYLLIMFRFLPCALAFLVPIAASAQTQMPSSPPVTMALKDMLHVAGKDVTVSLLTAGNGDDVWERFGHTAIWIHDNMSGRDSVFNWGVFDSRTHFVLRFMQGLMLVQMDGETLDRVLSNYRNLDRDVISQELNLSTDQRDSLLHILAINAQPENLRYRYNYFADNCSTRPRDILDRVLGGQLRIGADSVTPTSYRWHTLRLMQMAKPLALGADIALGEPADKPINVWQAMFLPRQLHDWVASRQIRDGSGATHPLVRAEYVLYRSTRSPEPNAPPRLAAWLTAVGVLIAALFAWLGSRAANGGRGTRITASIVFGVWSFACGLLGLILTLLWTVTDHRFGYANENLLLFNPIWLVLVVALPMYVMRGSAARTTRVATSAVAALSMMALLAHLAGLSRQDNLAIIGLALPAALATAQASFRSRRRGQA